MRGGFKWYDIFLFIRLASDIANVALNWNKYCLCYKPLPTWLLVDTTTVFIFRLLMFVDHWLATGLDLDFGRQQRDSRRFCARVVVLCILALLLYPFMFTWTVVGSIWFRNARNCLLDDSQNWNYITWLLASYCGLVCIAWICVAKWLMRRRAQLLRAQPRIPISEFGILVDMVRVPDWAFEAAGQEMASMGQDAATYHPGQASHQSEPVEALIQELPKFTLKSIPTDCTECPICLEEFYVGNEVRCLPCAHNFHLQCIDQWLRSKAICPRCRCSVFPDLDLSTVTNLQSSFAVQEFSNSEITADIALAEMGYDRYYQN